MSADNFSLGAAPGDPTYFNSAPSTPRQRLYLRVLMDGLNLSTFEITLFHRKHFVAADIEFPAQGKRIDDVLTELTRDQASALVKVLEKEKRK